MESQAQIKFNRLILWRINLTIGGLWHLNQARFDRQNSLLRQSSISYLYDTWSLTTEDDKDSAYTTVPHQRRLLCHKYLRHHLLRARTHAEELNHERIHTAQQRELLYVGFYVWYALEWLCLLIKYRNGIKAYFNIRFEKEAYRHQNNLLYLKFRKHYHYQWAATVVIL